MSIGVAVYHDDARVQEEVVDAIDASEGVHLVAADDRSGEAQVALVGGAPLRTFRREGMGLVVLSAGDPVAEARAGFEAGASAFLRWPDDAPALIRVVAKVAVPPDGAGAAKVLAVAGARGGAGATTVAALLAASVPDSLVIDFDPVGAGQRAFAPEGAGVASLDRALASPVPEVIVRVAEPHAAGRALYRDPGEPVDRDAASVLVLAARRAASLVVADVGRLNSRGEATLRGAAPLVVLADDVASLRAARSFLDAGGEASFVLNRLRRRGLRAAHVERALGQRPVAVLPPDRRLARAPDLGVLPKRIPRALRKVAKA